MMSRIWVATNAAVQWTMTKVCEAKARLPAEEQRAQIVVVLQEWAREHCVRNGGFIPPNELAAISHTETPGAALIREGFSDMAERFDSLWAEGDQMAPEAAWLYAEALAGLEWPDNVTHLASMVSHTSLWSVAYQGFMETAAGLLQDRGRLEWLEQRIGETIDKVNADPVSYFAGDREEGYRWYVEAGIQGAQGSQRLSDLWQDDPAFVGWHVEWLPLVDLVRRTDAARYVKLLERFTFPQAVTAALQFSAIKGDAEVIKELVAIAPAVLVGHIWNGNKTAPLLLAVALDHIRQLTGAPRLGVDVGMEEIEGECSATSSSIVEKLLARSDGVTFATQWLVYLVQRLVGQSGWRNIRLPPAFSDNLYAEWSFMTQVSERLLAIPDLVTREYPEGDAKSEPFAIIAGICSTSEKNPRAARALWAQFQGCVRTNTEGRMYLMAIAPRVDNWAHQMYGQMVAWQDNAPATWRAEWSAIYTSRLTARYTLALSNEESGAAGKWLAAAGTWGIEWLVVFDRKEEAQELWYVVLEGAHESWLTEVFNRDYWDDVIVHLFARHPGLFRDANNRGDYAKKLGCHLKRIVGLERVFVFTVIALTYNGAQVEDVRQALNYEGYDHHALGKQLLALPQPTGGKAELSKNWEEAATILCGGS
ncbi:MAG: hypothetical protein ACYDEV_00395 [Acidiferrobacter sp.]